METMLQRIEDYQNGDLSFEKTVMLFQDLVDTGLLWRVNSNIFNDVVELIDRGYVLQR
tara:strand:- start:1591 stop:1764 length:174 start_codon:yes stop_codon:yes gene_type:complete